MAKHMFNMQHINDTRMKKFTEPHEESEGSEKRKI